MNTKNIALCGLMLSQIIVLSIIESLFPVFPFLPGIKLGLSNIVIMYSIFFMRKKYTILLACFKSLFVFLTRGLTASLLSLGGGMASILIILVFILIFREKISYITLSILGAIFHNIGQITVLAIIIYSYNIFAYCPVLIISGIFLGAVTGTLLDAIMPAFKKIFNEPPRKR